ncbi:MAG: hypothetical protein GTO02_15370 [Candidatus Dadabacteria bacterium]|nr:hypothetical protein [Candidatus Dadabacteria bacterium]
MKTRLIDKNELMTLHPALKGYRLDWLIRTRKIPIIKIGNRNYFNEFEIHEWIKKHKINMDGV